MDISVRDTYRLSRLNENFQVIIHFYIFLLPLSSLFDFREHCSSSDKAHQQVAASGQRPATIFGPRRSALLQHAALRHKSWPPRQECNTRSTASNPASCLPASGHCTAQLHPAQRRHEAQQCKLKLRDVGRASRMRGRASKETVSLPASGPVVTAVTIRGH